MSRNTLISTLSARSDTNSKNTEAELISEIYGHNAIKMPTRVPNSKYGSEFNLKFEEDTKTPTFKDILAQIVSSTNNFVDITKNLDHQADSIHSFDYNTQSPLIGGEFQNEEINKRPSIESKQEMKIKKLSEETMKIHADLFRSRKTVIDLNSKISGLKKELIQEKENNKILIGNNEVYSKELELLDNYIQKQQKENQDLKQENENYLKEIQESM